MYSIYSGACVPSMLVLERRVGNPEKVSVGLVCLLRVLDSDQAVLAGSHVCLQLKIVDLLQPGRNRS